MTGNTPDEINTLMQLAALKNQRPEVLERAHQLLFMPDLIGYFLTGKQACEFTIASTSQCLNPERTGIHTELLERLGLQPDLFAPLRYPGEILGTLKPEIAAECGCGEIDVLLCGAHDTASAIYALPTEENHPIFLSCGTWAITGQILDQPVITEASAQLGVSNEGSPGGKTRLVRNLTGLWIIQQCKAELQRQGTALTYEEIEAMMDKAQSYDGLIDSAGADLPRIRPDDQANSRLSESDRSAAAADAWRAVLVRLPEPGRTDEAGVRRAGSPDGAAFRYLIYGGRRLSVRNAAPEDRRRHRKTRDCRTRRGHGAGQHRRAADRGRAGRGSCPDHRSDPAQRENHDGRSTSFHDFPDHPAETIQSSGRGERSGLIRSSS